MTHHEFDILSEKYLAGNCSPEEIAMLQKWSDLHFAQSDANRPFAAESEAMETEQLLWDKIQSDALVPTKRLWLHSKWLWAGVAASFTLLISVLYFTREVGPLPASRMSIQGIETKNIGHSQHKVTLPDGSLVTLAENASIVTEENYGKGTRTVYLTGEAFFDIKRNTKMPFLVHTGDLVTEVLGTSFRIKPQSGSTTIEVSVKSGRVSVYATDPANGRKKNGVIITPNQKVLYDTKSKTIRQDIVDAPEVILPHPTISDFQFEEATIQKVLTMMQNAYGVEILVGNPVLEQCAFTGDLNGLSMYRQLDMVCGVVNAEYEIRGTTIFVSGSGCNATR
ncbi:FecR family protein [Dyadobacter sp. CY323]|uniref:FecR family protein n=1 Tax=Dyadobacter sp. CY323 TaxID=2907302 RepID=UPI001F35D92E|nr:FecR family protein [Dyadobacter sp. CY323]MCE6988158.1 FecR family protein [Dyadobacter sp. CY323]